MMTRRQKQRGTESVTLLLFEGCKFVNITVTSSTACNSLFLIVEYGNLTCRRYEKAFLITLYYRVRRKHFTD